MKTGKKRASAQPSAGSVLGADGGAPESGTLKLCVSCGMPLRAPEDLPGGEERSAWCRHCARPDGSLQSYEERLGRLADFIVMSQGLDEGAARRSARSIMARMPAWKGAGEGA